MSVVKISLADNGDFAICCRYVYDKPFKQIATAHNLETAITLVKGMVEGGFQVHRNSLGWGRRGLGDRPYHNRRKELERRRESLNNLRRGSN